MKPKRRADTVSVGNTRREVSRKIIDKLVLKYWKDIVEIIADSNGKRTYIINYCIIAQFNTSEDVRNKRKQIDILLERVRDLREKI